MRISSQRRSILGSFCGRLAFMEKSVRGRFKVFFRSSIVSGCSFSLSRFPGQPPEGTFSETFGGPLESLPVTKVYERPHYHRNLWAGRFNERESKYRFLS